jgi:hypothetical protein
VRSRHRPRGWRVCVGSFLAGFGAAYGRFRRPRRPGLCGGMDRAYQRRMPGVSAVSGSSPAGAITTNTLSLKPAASARWQPKANSRGLSPLPCSAPQPLLQRRRLLRRFKQRIHGSDAERHRSRG